MSTDADTWLTANGLEKYCDVFRENDVDMRALPHLSDEDLRELGLSLGHRRIFLAALKAAETPVPVQENKARDSDGPAGPDPKTAPDPTEREATDAEHRHLSVIFIDMAGSTQLSEQLDPEDMRDLLQRYQDTVTAEVTRFGGQVAKFMGDGILAHFGWPTAFEDHAERAVRAGLSIVSAVDALPRPEGARYSVRLGVASGPVVVGDLIGNTMREDDAMVGSVVNLAARLQTEAENNTVAISRETRNLIGRGFELKDLGARPLKGFEAPRHIYLAIAERAVETRFEATRSGADTPLVGRDEEMALLTRSWEAASSGHGQVVLLSGEAGIGKSRIAQAVVDSFGGDVGELIRFQCAPYHINSAFHPIVERLTHVTGTNPSDTAEENFKRVADIAESHFLDRETDAAVYASLVGVPLPDELGLKSLEPQALKHRIIETLTRSVVERASRFPLLLIVEDVHWIDPSSLETFERIVEICGDLSVMMVLTHRPEWSCDWSAVHPHVSVLRLGRLSSQDASRMIEGMLERKLEDGVVEELVDRTDGVPLFVEELARAISDTGDGQLEDAVPESLQGVLLARLERVSRKSRSVALVASVIGRDFDRDVLATVAELDDASVREALEELRRANIIYESGLAGGAFAFRHALIQDAAYQALLRRNRRILHGKLAHALERLRPADADREPELLARHFTEAGDAASALRKWTLAANRALGRSATYEAVSHAKEAFAAALSLAGEVTPDADVTRARILLSEALTQSGNLPRAQSEAWTAAEEARAVQDPILFASAAMSHMDSVMLSADAPSPAISLCREALDDEALNDVGVRCKLLSHLARGHMMNGDFADSTRYGREAEVLARKLGDDKALFGQMMSRFLSPVIARDPEEVSNWHARITELMELSERNDEQDRGRAYSIGTYVATEMGDRDLMEQCLENLQKVGAARQHMHLDWVWLHGRAMRAILDGAYKDAEKLADDARRLGLRTHGSHVEGLFGVQMFTIRREQGRLAEVAPVIKRLLDDDAADASWKPGFAMIAAELGHTDAARRMMTEMAEDGFDLPLDAKYSATLGYLADTAVLIGDTGMAQTLYDRLLPYRGMTITIGVATVCHGAADRRLGALAALCGDWASMEEHYEKALEIDTAMRSEPCLAHSRAGYASAMIARGRKTDLARSDQLIIEAMETARKYDMLALQNTLHPQTH